MTPPVSNRSATRAIELNPDTDLSTALATLFPPLARYISAQGFWLHYSPGLVSSHAPEIKRRRASGRPNVSEVEERSNSCWADPSIRANHGLTTKWGQPASVSTECREHGVYLGFANNDRAAGYLCLLELCTSSRAGSRRHGHVSGRSSAGHPASTSSRAASD
jgi:hypothetical protein